MIVLRVVRERGVRATACGPADVELGTRRAAGCTAEAVPIDVVGSRDGAGQARRLGVGGVCYPRRALSCLHVHRAARDVYADRRVVGHVDVIAVLRDGLVAARYDVLGRYRVDRDA